MVSVPQSFTNSDTDMLSLNMTNWPILLFIQKLGTKSEIFLWSTPFCFQKQSAIGQLYRDFYFNIRGLTRGPAWESHSTEEPFQGERQISFHICPTYLAGPLSEEGAFSAEEGLEHKDFTAWQVISRERTGVLEGGALAFYVCHLFSSLSMPVLQDIQGNRPLLFSGI